MSVRAIAALPILLAVVLLPAPAVSSGTTATSFVWYADATATGPGAFRATIDFGPDNLCTASLEGTAANATGPLLFFGFGAERIIYTSGEIVHAHSGALGIDTREGPYGARGLRITYEAWPVSGIVRFTVLNVAMDGWAASAPSPMQPAGFAIACTEPIQVVGLAGSREATAFNEETLRHGTAVTAHGLVARPHVNVADSFQTTLGAPAVEFDLYDEGTAHTEWTLHAPDATYQRRSLGGDTSFHHAAGPGRYAFELQRAGEGSLNGWMAGYAPVAALDEVLA